MREISCVGLGLMGSALPRAMLSAGHSTAVWNRSPGKAVALVGLGAKEACSFAEALTAHHRVEHASGAQYGGHWVCGVAGGSGSEAAMVG